MCFLSRIALALSFLFCGLGYAQMDSINFQETSIGISKHIEGSLIQLNNSTKDLAILIAGSGPTDRNGNQNFMKTDMLKKLANDLAKSEINSFRYDKRSVKQIKTNTIDNTISFDDFIEDAKSILNYFIALDTFENIYVIGHSQGSLIGILASLGEDQIKGFVSLSGVAHPIDVIIEKQIAVSAPQFSEDTKAVLEALRQGRTTTNFPIALSSLFNVETQPFLMSWMKYNPTEEFLKLDIPSLIINGTNDLQVELEEGELLASANKLATFKAITNMNHVLVTIASNDLLENAKSYNDMKKPLNKELIDTIIKFIKKEGLH